MYTCAEQLPIEIWLTIYQYLEAHSIFQAFQNLNYYFDQILASNHLLFYIRLKETDNNHLQNSTDSYWSDSVLNRVVCLRPGVQSRSNHFLEFLRRHVNKLIHLQSLSIQTHPRDILSISYICRALNELNRLEYLSLTCTPSQSLFESIFSIPTLRVCQLILRESTTKIDYSLDVNSQIKQLFIFFPGNVNYSLINLLLISTPKLKRFGISGSSFSFDQISIFTKQLFILPELRILKLKLTGGHFTSDSFKCLHIIMPVLKHFYFHYNKHVLSETFIDNFISYWWSIIEPMQYIDIHITGHIIFDNDDNNNWMELKKKRKILLDKSNQSNGSLKIEWTEKDFLRLRFIEITILKS